MTYTVRGKFKESQEVKELKEGVFARNFVIIVNEGNPNSRDMPIIFNMVGKQPRISLVDDLSEGDAVEIEFELRGKQSFNGVNKYFNNLDVRHITKL